MELKAGLIKLQENRNEMAQLEFRKQQLMTDNACLISQMAEQMECRLPPFCKNCAEFYSHEEWAAQCPDWVCSHCNRRNSDRKMLEFARVKQKELLDSLP